MDQRTYFPINKNDIKVLEQNGCRAEDWSKVMVLPGFDPMRIRDVIFQGEVKIGSLSNEVIDLDGIERKAGIFRATLRNVWVGDNCFISNVHIGLFNLIIQSDVIIENVGKIACIGETSFGNGHQVSALNESGGRGLKMTSQTSAQIAYLSVLYRENEKLISTLDKIAEAYANQIKNTKGFIGKNVRITNCDEILNVFINEAAQLNGVLSLKNGTIDSSLESPSVVGSGVIAEHFIFQKGSSVKDGALVFSSLIGEGTQVGKLFSSENSLFFANSECFLSEACSVFGGPYSVTHHKSTLLIAGMFSFFNAGSGTNQSNHMYKLGPVHQGILERGCKTGSYSYLLWPARIGAFSVIIGKHYANFDTSNFPFSYISETDGKSTIMPAMNFFTTGTLRDEEKWPARDRRKSIKKLDWIIFDVLSPFTMQKVIKGQKILIELADKSEKDQDYIFYQGIRLKRLLLKTAIRYYNMIIDKYVGDVLIKRAEKEHPQHIRELLKYDDTAENGDQEWIDMAGLICSKNRVERLIENIIAGKFCTYDHLHQAFELIYKSYQSDEWNWFLANYQKLNNCELFDEPDENIVKLIDQWKDSSIKSLNMVLQDAQKEFEGNVKIGFGIDGHADADFNNVRGRCEENPFIVQTKKAIDEVNRKYDSIRKLI